MMERRSRKQRRARSLAVLALAVLGVLGVPSVASPAPEASTAASGAAPASDGVLLRGDEDRPDDLVELMPVPAGARARYFHVDAAAFAAAATGAPNGDDAWRDDTSTCRSLAPRDLTLEVFDGRTVSVDGVRAQRCTLAATAVAGIDRRALGSDAETTSWIGQAVVDGSILVSASFVVVRSADAPTVVIGRIDDAQGHHVVQPVGAGGLAVLYQAPDVTIREDGMEDLVRRDLPPPTSGGGTLPPASPNPDPNEDVPVSGNGEPSTSASTGLWEPPTNADAMRTIRIAVVYGNGVSSTDALWHAASGANDTNTSLLNSEVPVQVEIAGSVVHANFNETASMGADLQAFRAPNDGQLDVIHLLRPARQADLGMLVLPGPAPGTCAGLAFVATSVEASDKAVYSVQDVYGCNNTVMAHELGHNMGSQHDPANTPGSGQGWGAIPLSFSFGHFVSTKARDNMAYDTFCAAPCPTKPQYANPDVDFVGLPGYPSGTANRRGAESIALVSWSLSQIYPLTSNDHLWSSAHNRTHTSTNVAASTGDDPEAPFTVFGGSFSALPGIFWYFPDKGPDRLWSFDSGATLPLVQAETVIDPYVPAVGDFDGDTRDDIFWHAPGTSPDWLWWGRTNFNQIGSAPYTDSFNVTGTYRPTAGDFDGDGRDDLLWYAPNGQDRIWWGGSSFGSATSLVTAGPGLVPIAGDFDGDGRDDILWYGRGSTPDRIWWGQAARSSVGSWTTTSSRTIVGTYLPAAGDFDGDGRDDIMMYGPGSGADYVWWGHQTRATFGPGSQTVTTVSGQYATPVVIDHDFNGADDLYWFAYG